MYSSFQIIADIFHQILECEEKYYNGQVNQELIHFMIELYARCIEHYDSIQDPVGVYFHEKLQILLASKNTLKALRQPVEINVEQKPIILDDLKMPSDLKVYNAENKKKGRVAKASIFMEVQETQSQQDLLLKSLMESASQNHEKVTKVIENDLQKQNDTIKERMEKRKQTMQNTMTQRSSHSGQGGSVIGSLDQLEPLQQKSAQNLDQFNDKTVYQTSDPVIQS